MKLFNIKINSIKRKPITGFEDLKIGQSVVYLMAEDDIEELNSLLKKNGEKLFKTNSYCPAVIVGLNTGRVVIKIQVSKKGYLFKPLSDVGKKLFLPRIESIKRGRLIPTIPNEPNK